MGGNKKKPNAEFQLALQKKPVGYAPPSEKRPSTGSLNPESYYQDYPAWRLSRAEMCDPYGWHQLDAETAAYIRDRLAAFEGRTWAEILIVSKKQNHSVPVEKLSKAARDRLAELNVIDDEIVSLYLSSKERIYGFLNGGVFSILWWDPDHQVWPYVLKYT